MADKGAERGGWRTGGVRGIGLYFAESIRVLAAEYSSTSRKGR